MHVLHTRVDRLNNKTRVDPLNKKNSSIAEVAAAALRKPERSAMSKLSSANDLGAQQPITRKLSSSAAKMRKLDFVASIAQAFYRGLQRLHGRLHGLVVQGRKVREKAICIDFDIWRPHHYSLELPLLRLDELVCSRT